MSRKITFVAVFAVALTFAVDSQAFAKGGNKGGKGGSRSAVHNNRGHWSGRFEHDRRGGWGVDYASYPVVVSEAPVVDEDSVIDATPVVETYDSYGYFGGHRGHEFRHDHGRTGGHRNQGGHGGKGGHGKK